MTAAGLGRWVAAGTLLASLSGCGVMTDITRRVVIDQTHYNEPADNLFVCARDRLLAAAALREFKQTYSDIDPSRHFEHGFKQGFVDHLEDGATQPPVLPPRRYWKVVYQSQSGHDAINDWFDGYRLGVIAAEQSGFRQYIEIPVSVALTSASHAEGAPARELPSAAHPAPAAVPASPVLPPPKPMPPAAPAPAPSQGEPAMASGPRAPRAPAAPPAHATPQHEISTAYNLIAEPTRPAAEPIPKAESPETKESGG